MCFQFHPGKCEVLGVSRGKGKFDHQYTLHGQTLKAVNNTRYLGITLASDATWETHINITNKASRTLSLLRKTLKIGASFVKDRA